MYIITWPLCSHPLILLTMLVNVRNRNKESYIISVVWGAIVTESLEQLRKCLSDLHTVVPI